MDGLLYLGTILAAGLVIHWVFLNERLRKDDATSGLFAMRRPLAKKKKGAAETPAEEPGKRPSRRER